MTLQYFAYPRTSVQWTTQKYSTVELHHYFEKDFK